MTFTPDHTPPYHSRVETHNGSIRYHKLWIDTHGLPHDTDTYVSDYQAIACDKVDAATWIDHDAAEDARYMYTLRSSNADDDEEEPELKTHICGPSTIIFPVNLGWHSQLTHPVPNDLIISSLSQLTIKRITALLTRQQIGSARPNCEANWQSRIGGSPIPFESLWKTLGTPLSDATEEKQWRKLLHRATNVRGRNIGASTQACRMRCGCPKESMLHIIECRVAKKLWTAVFVFTMYLGSDKVTELYSRPQLLWLFCPLLLYWITRIWHLAWRGRMPDDPLAFAARDPQTYLVGAIGIAAILFAI